MERGREPEANVEDLRLIVTFSPFGDPAEREKALQTPLLERLDRLETYFGAQLFDRATNPISLTKEGAVLAPSIRKVMREYDNLLAAKAAFDAFCAGASEEKVKSNTQS